MLHSVTRPGSTGIPELLPGGGAALTAGNSLASLRNTGLADALLCQLKQGRGRMLESVGQLSQVLSVLARSYTRKLLKCPIETRQ